jgi:glycosyltransferase involved in cell wall biosynthesis
MMTEAANNHIGFFFGLGHGHYTQFLNFQECVPTSERERAHWFALHGESSGDRWSSLPFLPATRRYSRNVMWHLNQGLATRPTWDALFLSLSSIDILKLTGPYRAYLYTDLTDSLKAELAPWYDHQLQSSGLANAAKQWLRQRLHQSCRGIFTMSQWAADGVCRDYGVAPERVHVVHPGANLTRWPFVDRSDRSAESPTRILMVGGQFRLKGGELLLQWAEQTALTNWEIDIVTWPSELPDWVHSALGNPANDARISQSLAPRLPNVRVHCGLKANTPTLMQLFTDANIFCLPTQADGSSIASLEAMASGLPVVVGAVGGIPELIDDGETGYLLRPGDLSDLSDRLERLIQQSALRRQMGRAARAACERYYNVTRQLRDILAVIDGDIAADKGSVRRQEMPIAAG